MFEEDVLDMDESEVEEYYGEDFKDKEHAD